MVDSKRKSRTGDSENARAKRQRVSRACDQCRAAREKCDGIQPICFTCASSNRDCAYTTNPKRRGIQPGYIRTLELTLAWTLCNVPASGEALIGLLQEERGQSLISSTDSAAADKLHNKWRKHRVSRALDRVLSGESTNDLFERPVSTSGDDEEEEAGQHPSIVQGTMLTPDSLKTGTAPIPIEETIAIHTPDRFAPSIQSNHVDVHKRVQTLHLPAGHWRLVDIYFAYTHSWLPLASKEQILKLCYSYPSDGLALIPGRDSADHAELWSILALASIQDKSIHSLPGPAVDNILSIAESLVYHVVEDIDAGHVGALLTLALINIAVQRLSLAWTLLGRAIRTSLWLKQNYIEHNTMPLRTFERIEGLLLGCFVVETVLAAQIGIVPSLRTDLVKASGRIPEEGLDEWQPWTACDGFQSKKQSVRPTLPSQAKSTFNQLLKLCYILNDRIVENQLNRQTTISTESLSNWLATLPASLGPLHSMSPEQTSPQKLHLFLTFLVGRAYDTNNHETIEEALSVLDHFTYALGPAAMPPLFACFLNILKEKALNDGFQQNRIAGILTRFSTVWRISKQDGETLVSPAMVDFSTPRQDNDTTPRPLVSGMTSIDIITSPHISSPHLQRGNPMHIPSPASVILSQQPADVGAGTGTTLTNLTPPQLYNNQQVRSYSVDQSMDLEALFDHFTSIDSTDQAGLHPQFMQNLGFAPNANLADLMTNDFGWGFNPG